MVLEGYLFKNLSLATFFTALILCAVILLTQSLRFLELVIESGASSGTFFLLTLLALPRFVEVILPLALTAAGLFVYNRMIMDSEIAVMRSAGLSPYALGKPALTLSLIVTLLLMVTTTWLAPVSSSAMIRMQQVIKAQYSALLLREGVFNAFGNHLTVYIKEKDPDGTLRGLIIHDSRPENKQPVTIMAKRGAFLLTDEGQQVLVYDGTRQTFDPQKGVLSRLNFERYTIELPDSAPVSQRWKEPGERTFFALLSPDLTVKRDRDNLHAFMIEAHTRILTPFLAMTFTAIVLAALLLGPMSRRGQGRRILMAVSLVIVIQGVYLAATNIALERLWGLVLMYLLVFVPMGLALFLLGPWAEKTRYFWLNRARRKQGAVLS